MKRLIYTGIVFVLGMGFLACAVAAGSDSANSRPDVEGLLNKKPLERQGAFNRVLRERKATIQELISLIERRDIDKEFYGPLHRAIVLLGKLRAKEAVKPLSGFLTYVPEGFMLDEDIPSEAYYVAAVALWQIGQPSISAMLMVIRHSDDPVERNIAAWVIMQIEGQDQATHRMEVLVVSDKLYKERFEAAKQFIETYKPTFEHPHRLGRETTKESE